MVFLLRAVKHAKSKGKLAERPAPTQICDVAQIAHALDLHVGDIQCIVVYQHHDALNWLTGFEPAEWDQIDTPI